MQVHPKQFSQRKKKKVIFCCLYENNENLREMLKQTKAILLPVFQSSSLMLGT